MNISASTLTSQPHVISKTICLRADSLSYSSLIGLEAECSLIKPRLTMGIQDV